jgi:hypothetical protein
MCLDRGRKPTTSNFKDRVHGRNLDNLTIWQNVGLDVDQGAWAIAGARMGTYKTMLTDWDFREVQWFDSLELIWESVKSTDPAEIIQRYSEPLQSQLDLPTAIMMPKQSQFFKHHYGSNWHNKGVMTREIDVIRKQEGW